MGLIKRKLEAEFNTPSSRKKIWILITLGACCLLAVALVAFIRPLTLIAKNMMRISEDSLVYNMIKKPLENIHISAYVFNVTNADDFIEGKTEKIKVEEVGPFTYREIRSHQDMELDLETNILRYTPKFTAYFVPEESVADPHEVHVVMPNMAMLGMASMISTYFLPTRFTFNFLVNQRGSKPFINCTAHEYLWGYEEPLVTLGNMFMPSWIDFDKIGLLDRMYNSTPHHLEVYTKPENKFEIKTLDGSRGLPKWGYDSPGERSDCNTFTDAYEAHFFPDELTSDRRFRLYHKSLCRFIDFEYAGTTSIKYKNDAFVYKFSNDTYNMHDSRNTCLCRKGMCINGMSDVSPCFYDMPLAMSNAHFSGVDPDLYKNIEGLHPDYDKYRSTMWIEPITGIPQDTYIVTQLNLVIKDVSYSNAAAKFSNLIIPIAYFKVRQTLLPDIVAYYFYKVYDQGPKIILSIEILLILIGLSLLAWTGRLIYCNRCLSNRKDHESALNAVKDFVQT